ncbi:OLC1v1013726C1 [Oldenlandia corymbosa var. corymbosa]|uniref:CASP-like protein n=1 Tax=Oldenlandia corymbosa var. corymbosa TaxID=529605 RepID=A0AAV1DYZ5_OLDCO|nr:OLC1v1013726C1 [Oldenlandia corymbosa var. corymbosa]
MAGIEGQKIINLPYTSSTPSSANNMITLKTHKISFFAQIFCRVLVTGAAVAATWIILTSKQTVVIFGMTVDARYSYSSAFKFFAYVNLIVSGFTALSCFLLIIIGNKAFTTKKYFCLFLHDLNMTTLLMAACAAATSFGMIGQHGNEHAGWMPICDHFHKYCGRVSISIALSYFSVVLYLILTIMSAYSSR